MKQFLYLFIDLGVILIPFIYSFHPRIKFHLNFKILFVSTLVPFIPFIIWDAWFTEIGFWGFNPDYLTGITIYNLPIEEILFFWSIPFSCVFTYYCLKEVFGIDPFKQVQRIISTMLIIGLISLGILNFELMYTFITFISLGIVIFVLEYLQNKQWLSNFYFTWTIIFFPFFISNGILTGSWIDAPIVWYNESEFMGFRMGTIPFEDTWYGMLLVILNIWVFEALRARLKPT